MTGDILLRPACGDCGKKLRAISAGYVATVVADRRCPSCGSLWRIVIKPMNVRADGKLLIHRADLTKKETSDE